jgi:membrane protease subunit HflC
MLAYRKAMTDSDTTLVLSPDSDFFRYFKDIGGSSVTDK